MMINSRSYGPSNCFHPRYPQPLRWILQNNSNHFCYSSMYFLHSQSNEESNALHTRDKILPVKLQSFMMLMVLTSQYITMYIHNYILAHSFDYQLQVNVGRSWETTIRSERWINFTIIRTHYQINYDYCCFFTSDFFSCCQERLFSIKIHAHSFAADDIQAS